MITIDTTLTGLHMKELMKSKGLTYKDIIAATGVTAPAIYKWYRGDCLPTVDNLVVLADLYGCSMDDILVVTRPQKKHVS